MPLPSPSDDESRSDWISRCMADEKMNQEFPDNEQRYAVCVNAWKDKGFEMEKVLLEAVRMREKKTEFGYGILTADRWVRNMLDLAGVDVCYRTASCGMTSFSDVLHKAANVLTYSNQDMVVEERVLKVPEDIVLPKNTLMVFKHVLTTPRKDRDGDILRTQGAIVDPKMLLLWQHVHTLPIGKMLAVVEHSDKRLTLLSCIVDMNELSHDAAVMVENDMARFSHGFRALEYEQLKEVEGETTGGGFDIKSFEVMEESIVSVPSNADAQQEEVLLSLVEGGKLTSAVMKEAGKTLRSRRNIQIPVEIELGVTDENPPENAEETDENKSGSGSGAAAEDGSGTEGTDGTPEEAEAIIAAEAVAEVQAEGKDMTEIEEKAGRTLSSRNLSVLRECVDDMEELIGMGTAGGMSRSATAVLERVHRKLSELIDTADKPEADMEGAERKPEKIDVKEAMSIVLAEATTHQRGKLLYILQTLKYNEERQQRSEQFRKLVKSKR